MKKITSAIALLFVWGYLVAQPTAGGLRFSTCIGNKDLPADFYKGKYLVLDFWATWCGPCIASFPKVSALANEYGGDQRIVFASISAETVGHLDTFFKRKKDILPGVLHLVDDNGATWGYFNVNLIPNLMVFDPSGNLVFSGRVEDLAEKMPAILNGANYYHPVVEKAQTDQWPGYLQNASFIAMTGDADANGYGGTSCRHSINYDSVTIQMGKSSLTDAVAYIGGLTSYSVIADDKTKADKQIFLCYKQSKNDYPEFDKGVFKYQYQNHALDVLAREYGFHWQWQNVQVTVYKIAVKNKALLDSVVTLSTHGSSASSQGNHIVHIVNYTLSRLAAMGEDYLNMAVIANNNTQGYDMDVDLSTMATFEKSISKYGLGIEKEERHVVRKLKMVFH